MGSDSLEWNRPKKAMNTPFGAGIVAGAKMFSFHFVVINNNNNNRRLVTLAEHTSDHGKQTNSSTKEKGEHGSKTDNNSLIAINKNRNIINNLFRTITTKDVSFSSASRRGTQVGTHGSSNSNLARGSGDLLLA